MKGMKIYVSLVLMALMTLIGCQNEEPDSSELTRYFKDLPFVMNRIQEPVFPAKTVNITEFEAVGDGHTDNTIAINKAIEHCANAGGGMVVIPAGVWFTGPVILQSDINLHLEKGAILQFSGVFEDYPIIETSWEGLPMVRCRAPIYGKDLKNIAITGEGIIDGAGEYWRPVQIYETTEPQWDDLVKSGGVVGTLDGGQHGFHPWQLRTAGK